MTEAIQVSAIEAFAMSELAHAAKTKDRLAQDLKAEWAYGIALLLRGYGHHEAADRVEAERKRVLELIEAKARAALETFQQPNKAGA